MKKLLAILLVLALCLPTLAACDFFGNGDNSTTTAPGTSESSTSTSDSGTESSTSTSDSGTESSTSSSSSSATEPGAPSSSSSSSAEPTPGPSEPAEPASEGLVFTKNADNLSYAVTGYEGNGGVVLIPDTYEGLPVTVIGEEAFMGCETMNGVIIPGSVTTINSFASLPRA